MKRSLSWFRRTVAVVAAVTTVVVVAPPPAAAAEPMLLNASYDVAREFYKDYDAAFVKHWKQATGQDVVVNQSHGGSSKQARAVADGLEADVVTMNSANDIDFLASRGVVPADWAKRFPDNAAPTYSTMLFLVRKGNPKGMKDWDDLAKPGVQVVIVNPKTGGNGRYSYMGAWGWAKKKGMTDADAAAFVGRVFANVPVLDTGGRGATTTFLQRNIGDVLVTFESEVEQVDREFGAGQRRRGLSVGQRAGREPGRDRRPRRAEEGHGRAREGLSRLAVFGRRRRRSRPSITCGSRSAKVMAAHAATFQPIQLFTVDEMFGSWKEAQTKHFDDGGAVRPHHGDDRSGDAGVVAARRFADDRVPPAERPARLPLALGTTLLYLALIVLIPLSAAFLKTFTLTWPQFVDIVTAPRVVASLRLSFGAALLAALVNAVVRPARRVGAGALPLSRQRASSTR